MAETTFYDDPEFGGVIHVEKTPVSQFDFDHKIGQALIAGRISIEQAFQGELFDPEIYERMATTGEVPVLKSCITIEEQLDFS